MRKIGINLHAYKGLSDEEYLKTISSFGFEAMFSGMREKSEQVLLAEISAKHGISYDTIHAPFDKINDIWLSGEGGDFQRDRLFSCIDNAAAAHVPTVVVHLSSGLTPPPVTDIGRERFDSVINHAAKKGVVLAFENQRKLFNLAWVFEFYPENEFVRFCWDTGHESCFTPGREFMPLFMDKLSALHIHDNFGEFGGDLHMLPFDASIDFKKAMGYVNASGFTGTLMLEVSASQMTRYKKDSIYEHLSPYEYIEKAAISAKKLRDLIEG
jgi:sugar phosphate isomerase/epimerase